MPEVIVKQRVAPIRLGFLVNPSKPEQLKRAIEFSTSYWGGKYFPIIPHFSRFSLKNRKRYRYSWSREEFISGYVRNFALDFLVFFDEPNEKLKIALAGIAELVDHKRLFTKDNHQEYFKYGITTIELTSWILQNEFKYQRTDNANLIIPKFGAEESTFLKAIFGNYPSEYQVYLKKRGINDHVNVTSPEINKVNWVDFLNRTNWSPLDIADYELGFFTNSLWASQTSILVLDSGNFQDILDFWNLRAAGWNILPIPYQQISLEPVRKILNSFIKAYEDSSPLFKNLITIFGGSLQTQPDLIEKIQNEIIEQTKYGHLSFQWRYPRVWGGIDEAGWDKVIATKPVQNSSINSLNTNEGYLTIKADIPKFVEDGFRSDKPRLRNDLSFKINSNKILYCEIFPEGDNLKLEKAIQGSGMMQWKFRPQGASYLANGNEVFIKMRLPESERIFKYWFESQGWKIELSAAGAVAREMLKSIGGISGIKILADKRLLNFFRLFKGQTHIPAGQFIQECRKLKSIFRLNNDHDMARWFLNIKAVEFGFAVNCPNCHQNSWYSLKQIDSKVSCPKCISKFNPDKSNPKKTFNFAYKGIGPYSLPNEAHGSFTVLLSLRFLSQVMNGSIAPSPFLSGGKRKSENGG